MKLRSPWVPLFVAAGAAGLYLTAGTTLSADHDSPIDKSFVVGESGTLVIDADCGAIELDSGAATAVEVHVVRRVRGGSQAHADDLFAKNQITFQQDGNRIAVRGKTAHAPFGGLHFNSPQLEVTFHVTVPRQFAAELKTAGDDIRVGAVGGPLVARTSSGAIRIREAQSKVDASDSGGDIEVNVVEGALVASTSSGEIHVRTAKSTVELTNSGGDIEVETAAGPLSAATSSGTIHLKDMQGSARASNSGGDVTIDYAGGAVIAKTSSGSIRIGRVRGGGAELHNSGGDVTLESATGAVSAETSSGSVRLGSVAGKVVVRNSGGDVAVEAVEGDLTAQTTSGSIQVGSVRGGADLENSGGDITLGSADGMVVAKTSSGSIYLKSAGGRVDARNAGGDILIDAAGGSVFAHTSSGVVRTAFVKAPTEDSDLEAAGGDVHISLPASAAVALDARASGGAVVAGFPVTTTVVGGLPEGQLRGTIRGGGPAMVLRSSSGDIRIEKSDERSE